MANDITSTIWRIDTLPFSYAYRLKIKVANWAEQSAAGNRIVATQYNGKPLIDSMAQQANFLQNFGELGWVNGITVTELDSGVLYLNVGGGK